MHVDAHEQVGEERRDREPRRAEREQHERQREQAVVEQPRAQPRTKAVRAQIGPAAERAAGVGRAALGVAQLHDAVARRVVHERDELGLVRDEQQRGAGRAQRAQLFSDRGARLAVEPGEGLVEHNHALGLRELQRERGAPRHPARELARHLGAVARPVEPHGLDQPPRLAARAADREGPARERERDGHVAADAERVDERGRLEQRAHALARRNVRAPPHVHGDAERGEARGRRQAGERAADRRLPGARAAAQVDTVALAQFQAQHLVCKRASRAVHVARHQSYEWGGHAGITR